MLLATLEKNGERKKELSVEAFRVTDTVLSKNAHPEEKALFSLLLPSGA